MPIYEFECQICGLTFEEILSAREEKIPPCPKCRTAAKVRKRMSACARHAGGAGASTGTCAPKGGFS
jgi:putative FmdB family regulatory protein